MNTEMFKAITRGWVLAYCQESYAYNAFVTFWRRLDGFTGYQLVIVFRCGSPAEAAVIVP